VSPAPGNLARAFSPWRAKVCVAPWEFLGRMDPDRLGEKMGGQEGVRRIDRQTDRQMDKLYGSFSSLCVSSFAEHSFAFFFFWRTVKRHQGLESLRSRDVFCAPIFVRHRCALYFALHFLPPPFHSDMQARSFSCRTAILLISLRFLFWLKFAETETWPLVSSLFRSFR